MVKDVLPFHYNTLLTCWIWKLSR